MFDNDNFDKAAFLDKLTALGESEMQLFRFLLDKPAGVILTVDTDIMLAQLLEAEELVSLEEDNKVIIPENIREAYRLNWSDEMNLQWRKRNWMYKCIEAGKYLYGVMTWGVLKNLFGLRYPHADMAEIRELFATTPSFYQWFTERDGKLVLNGYEKDDYYKYLENEIQGDTPFYIPTKEDVEELYDRGSLISLEGHAKLKDFIMETWSVDESTAELKLHDLYDSVNNRIRVSDAADAFAAGENGLAFPSDEIEVKFIELYMDMSRECRIRDNRGHDWFEMAALMAANNGPTVKRAKIGRNDPCPCGSGKKYKNCCGRN